jgi:hypothetical protein
MVVLGFVLGPAMLMAQDAPKAERKHREAQPAGEKKAAVPLQDLLLTGKIAKEEKAGKEGKSHVTYTLTTTAGTAITLPKPKADAPAAIKLDDYLNVNVKVVAKGREIEREGKKITKVMEILNIEKVPEAPAAQ